MATEKLRFISYYVKYDNIHNLITLGENWREIKLITILYLKEKTNYNGNNFSKLYL